MQPTKKPTNNAQAWEVILSNREYTQLIHDDGFFDITADQIKQLTSREPRLMCKQDYVKVVPRPLRDRKLSVLAIENGVYRVASTNPFYDVPTERPEAQEEFSIPAWVETIDPDNITSESKALDAAHASGMIDRLASMPSIRTLHGRERTGDFSFKLNDVTHPARQIPYDVSRVQIEVDGGYESRNRIDIIEAKMGRGSDTMNLRQTLYPELHYTAKFGKPVQSWYMEYYPGGLFVFTPFSVGEGHGELLCDLSVAFKLKRNDQEIVEEYCWDRLEDDITDDLTNHEAPFPQADDFTKVYQAYLDLLENEFVETEDLFTDYELVPRQFSYYAAVLKWMGLAVSDIPKHLSITPLGRKLGKMPERKRLYEMARICFSHPVTNMVLKSSDAKPSVELMKYYGLGGTTIFRRISTIRSWRAYFSEVLACD